ncbi:MAG TPA: DUF4838 domain-containing protein [Myxococcota bacterium]|nr:DUF4838 domain-containing protein [Myxococcota bacterium]HQK50096.1 DUF4838 domain-containing protein [Myxococcota bacterium]
MSCVAGRWLSVFLGLVLVACGGRGSGSDEGPWPDLPRDGEGPAEVAGETGRDIPETDPGVDPARDEAAPGDAFADLMADAAEEAVMDLPSDPGPDPDAPRDPGPDPFGDPGPDRPSFFLVQDGKSDHVLVVGPEASPSERQAAREVQDLFLQATGVTLPIVQEAPGDDVPRIVIGQGEAARALGVDPTPEALGEQGYVLRAVPPHVVIAGTPAVGTLYGAHRFLEEALQVRWVAPGVTIVPRTTEVRFPLETDETVQPAFRWRTTSYAWPGADRAFWVHQGDNNGRDGPDAEWGLQHGNYGQAHSYFWYVSPDEFFDTHPEYFSEVGGVRIREDTQLCLTNPEVLDIVTDRMLALIAAHPEYQQYNFSQMDHYNVCQCPRCKAMNEQYGTDGGTQFWFVNELAKRISQGYPDKQIGTLAYTYTEEPPKGMEMHPNVAVWLCHMYPSCDAHPIRTCEKNAEYRRRAEAWSRLTRHLYVWHYIVDFAHYYVPFPNFRAMAEDMRFYRDIGVEGVFLQGMGHAGGGGEFSLLRPWYGMRLLWDPDQDPDRLIRTFLRDYYGAAWGPIHDWIRLIQDRVDRDGIHMHLYTNPAQGYLTDDVVQTGEALFDEAARLVADDEVLRDRVEVARMPIMYARFFPRNGYRIEDGMLRWNPGQSTFEDVLAFVDMMNRHGFQMMREVQGTPDTMVLLWAILGVDQEVRTIRNPWLEVDVVPALAGRALRITHRPTGAVVTAWNRAPALFFPFAGGLEDRIGEGFDAMGWVEPASASEWTEGGVTVSLKTFDGWEVTRRYDLDPADPVLRVRTTVRNPGTTPREVRIRNHLEMDLGDLVSTRVSFRARDGTVVDQDMTQVVAGQREGRHFRQQEVPDGQWAFQGSKGIRMTHRFDPEEVESTWLYAYPVELQDLEMEVFGHRRTLGPGESAMLHAEYDLRPVP